MITIERNIVMIIEKRNAIGEIIYSFSVSLNHIDLSEFSEVKGDFGYLWEFVFVAIPKIDDTHQKEIKNLLNDSLNPNGEHINEKEVDTKVRMLVDHYLMTL